MNKRNKSILVFVLAILIAVSLVGCKTTKKVITKKPNNSTTSSQPSSSSQDTSSTISGDNSSSQSQDEASSSTSSNENTNNDENNDVSSAVQKSQTDFDGYGMNESNYTVYYVDNINGDDENDGRTTKKAWKSIEKVNETNFKPGSKILFKAGGIWNIPLRPKSSGVKGQNVVFDMYGKGPKPVINGDGELYAIELANLQYVEVRNLELTNTSEYEGTRKGVSVGAGGLSAPGEYLDGGIFNHIYLINLDIHDVSSIDGSRWSGGIVFLSYLSKNKVAYNDVLIQGCSIKSTEGNGITFASEYNKRLGLDWGAGEYFPSTGLRIRNNYITDIAGDGIYQNCADGAVIEHNTVTNTSYANGAYAGIWPHNSTDTIMQFNESYDNKLVGGDGQGFDVDINCERTYVQYNYSHDNEGGFILLCTDGINNGFNRDITVRYNISQNDKGQIFTLSGPISDVKVYNNTVYVKEGLNTRLIGSYDWGGGKNPNDARFTNNIFHMNGTGYSSLVQQKRIIFDTNVFFGTYNFSNLNAVNTISSDPMLTGEGTGKIGMDSVGGYKLKPGSPCIDAGITLNDSGHRDYFGNKVPQNNKTDLGAAEFVR